eukprot:scaffold114294_cov19-Tisochrysis_lutea.AAC.1
MPDLSHHHVPHAGTPLVQSAKPEAMAVDAPPQQHQQQQQPVRVMLRTSPSDPSSVQLVLTVTDAALKAGTRALQVKDSRRALKVQGRPGLACL